DALPISATAAAGVDPASRTSGRIPRVTRWAAAARPTGPDPITATGRSASALSFMEGLLGGLRCFSGRCAGLRLGVGDEIGDQRFDATPDVITNSAHRLEVLSCGIIQVPVFVPLSGEDRAGVAAAHGDDDVGGAHGVCV